MTDTFIHKDDIQYGRRKYGQDINRNHEVKCSVETLVKEALVLFDLSNKIIYLHKRENCPECFKRDVDFPVELRISAVGLKTRTSLVKLSVQFDSVTV